MSKQKQIDALNEERELLYAELRSAQDQCDQLSAEVEALRKDAERYRWLRDDNAYFPEEQMICGGDELDAAIDAAMAAKEG